MSTSLPLWLGTGGKGSRGIYRTRLDPDTGKQTEPVLAAENGNPGFVALNAERTRLAYGQRRTSQEEQGIQPTHPQGAVQMEDHGIL
jgi:6-phosphogluconolactonase (cycloisomerase 2 family)